MKRNIMLILSLFIFTLLVACGKSEPTSTDQKTEKAAVEESTVEETEVEKTDESTRDLPEGDYSEIGNGTAYISTSGGTSENGNIPVIYDEGDTYLLQIGLNTEGFDGGLLSYIYVDGMLLSKEQLADSQTSIELKQDQLTEGEHKVEIVQYNNNDTASDMVTYKSASYEVKAN